MFNELPETVPLKNSRRRKTFLSAAAIQAGLVALVIIVQMAMPDKLGQFQLLTTLYMAAAATEAVSHWKYEPTYLNGQPIPVILTARITFSLKNT